MFGVVELEVAARAEVWGMGLEMALVVRLRVLG